MWMVKDKLQQFLNKMTILTKAEVDKWDCKRFHYQIKIGKEIFDYYWSYKDWAIETACKLNTMWSPVDVIYNFHKETWIPLNKFSPLIYKSDIEEHRKKVRSVRSEVRDDEIKTNCLFHLISDLSYDTWDMTEFVCEFWYNKDEKSMREWEIIYHQIKLNAQKVRRCFTWKEIELLQDLYSDY